MLEQDRRSRQPNAGRVWTEGEFRHFTVTSDADGLVTVAIRVADRPINVLDWEVMNELDEIVGRIEQASHGGQSPAGAVVFRSDKESGFLAGADVHALASIDSPEEVRRIVAFGQDIFARIQWLNVPTVAVIHGPCLGGGLEWALACDYRLARDNSSTQLGLPEIKLGVIPGWGGTQRLPRLIGTRAALDLILRGRSLSASQAERIGLVDQAISPQDWERQTATFISQLAAAGDAAWLGPRGKSKLWQRLLDGTALGRRLVLRMARQQVASQLEHYPAVVAVLEAVAAACDESVDGYRIERERFAELIATPTCRNLLDLFMAREAARDPKTWTVAEAADEGEASAKGSSPRVSAAPIRRIGIVGAGVMGAGIAQLAAGRGFDVLVKEIDEAAVEAGRRRLAGLLAGQAKHKGWSRRQVDEVLARVRLGADPALLADADLVIEAAVEKESIKRAIFRQLDTTVGDHAVIASNTSSLSIESMAAATRRPGKVAGLHFFNPVHRMELVEVVAAPGTEPDTVHRLVTLVRALGKTPIVAKDSPGIAVNRVLFPYLGEALRMVTEGYDTVWIDSELKRFGMPMGPLELLDQVGIDVALYVAGSLREVLPEADTVIGPLAAMAEHDQLGKKSGSGFYHYRGGRRGAAALLPPGVRRVNSSDWHGSSAAEASHGYQDDGLTLVQRRLVYPMLIESLRCLQLGIVEYGWAVDLALVLGTGFAPHHGGPLHLARSIGRPVLEHNAERLMQAFGNRFAFPEVCPEVQLSIGR